MVIEFPSLAQIEGHQFVQADDGCLQDTEGFVADVRADAGPV
jgi:hypothetical protein